MQLNPELGFLLSHLGAAAISRARQIQAIDMFDGAVEALTAARHHFLVADMTHWACRLES